MKEIHYDGDISKDLININKDFNYKKEIALYSVISIVLAALLIKIGFVANFSFEYIISSCSLFSYNIISWIYLINKNKKYFNNKKEKSIEKIQKLQSNLEKENILLSLNNFKEYTKEETITTFKIIDNNENTYNKIEEIINKYYLLDNKNKIQVLKEVKKTINDYKSHKLYLLEEQDIKEELTNKVKKHI